MISFLKWVRDTFLAVLNGLARAVAVLVVLVLILVVISLARGDGQPGNMVLTLDLRQAIADSNPSASIFTAQKLTVMDVVLGLDAAGRDSRVKGMLIQLGNGALSSAQAEEISEAITRFRKTGKFAITQVSAFYGPGLGDYLTASASDQIWMQPRSNFAVSGAGGSEIFLKGLFDKIKANPQMAKRAEYKSAADMYMEKSMTPADREQLTRLMQSVYDAAAGQIAAVRHLPPEAVKAAFDASPQFSEDALKARLIDRIGYDDEARGAALARAGSGAETVKLTDYARSVSHAFGEANIAIVEGTGEIYDGPAHHSVLGDSGGIASDELSEALRKAAADKSIRAIVLRVDSPGGSVSASDQILHAVKMAQKAGKPVVVSMGSVAASGGYYISTSANRIVAELGTITGSIGVLTGKVSLGNYLGLIGVSADSVAVGKNTLMDSPFQPYTPEQWANINHQADVIYDDFMHKVAAGRKLPFAKVQEIAKGRVWSGSDAKSNGLVDRLGGFWSAADQAASLGHIPATGMVFKVYPEPHGFFGNLARLMGGMDAGMGTLQRVETLLNAPAVSALAGQLSRIPAGGPGNAVQLRAAHLPQP